MKVKKFITYSEDHSHILVIHYRLPNYDLHKEDGPAYIHFYNTGQLCSVGYYRNGDLHKEDGPAAISYSKSGDVDCTMYAISGKIITPMQFNRYRDSKIFDKLLEDLADET